MNSEKGGGGRDDRFQSLYRQYFRRVVKYYVRVSRVSEEDAEELAQEAFTRFYLAMDEYRGDAGWAYFQTIARNVLYNRIRAWKTAKRNAEMVSIDNAAFKQEPVAPPTPDYAERQQEEIQRKQLYDAIADLPAGQRQCILLWLQDCKYEEIAKALRISLDAVRSRIRDARKLLATRLGDQLPEDDE